MNLALSILQGLFWTWKTKVGYEFYLHLYKIIRSNIKPRKFENFSSLLADSMSLKITDVVVRKIRIRPKNQTFCI